MKLVKYIKENIELIKFSSFSLKNKIGKYRIPQGYMFVFIISLFIPPFISLIFFLLPYKIYRYIINEIHITHSCVKMKLKDIDCHYSEYSTVEELLKDKNRTEENVVNYNWDLLRESIKKYKNLRPLEVLKFNDTYRVVNGNHRYITLKDLYGEEYEVNVKINEKDII